MGLMVNYLAKTIIQIGLQIVETDFLELFSPPLFFSRC